MPNIVRYARGALEQNTGLTKFGQRYYNPARGAFTQQDTFVKLANPGNGNPYAYAGDSPINYIDPTGAINWGLVGLGLVIVFAVICPLS